jgi:hypothetical protein
MDKPKFTVPYERLPECMTLRDYFAGQAMQAFIIRGVIFAEGLNKKEAIAVLAYETADAMLETKLKEKNGG